MVIGVFVVLAFAYSLRVAPLMVSKRAAGIDQWFWKAYIEKLHRDGTFPPALPQFLLDAEQWYPPVFPLFMARLPATLFNGWTNHIAVIIDMVRMLLLLAATYFVTRSSGATLIAGSAYAVTPLLVTYNLQLNPRGLGALFLDAMWLTAGCVLILGGPAWLWLVIGALGGLVLLTHKMTTQLMVFTTLILLVQTSDLRWALIIPISVLAAFVLSGGFYRRVLQAHADILVFWYRNWPWSGSNPVLESPIYGQPGYESPSKYYRRGWVRRLVFVIGFNPWVPASLAMGILAAAFGYVPDKAGSFVFGWLAAAFIFALLTTIVPAFRCMGQGYLYGYNGSFPAALALGIMSMQLSAQWYWLTIVAATYVACIVALVSYFHALRSSRTMQVDDDLNAAINHLGSLPTGTVMCLPQHWHDQVAYRTGHRVAFGGHGYGFSLLEPLFPRLLLGLNEIFTRYNVRYLLTYRGFCNDKLLAELAGADKTEFGEYHLYTVLRDS
jgi:hypothetical protein